MQIWIMCHLVIISDNGSHFEGEVRKIMELYNFEHYKSSPYQLHTNGVVEAAKIWAISFDWWEES